MTGVEKMKILITGGGTGGHIYPGLAIAKNWKERDPAAEILFVGTKRGLEKDIVPKEGLSFATITVEGLPRKISLQSIKTGFKLIQGIWQAKKIIRDFQPDLVVGTGGYVCGPVVAVAAWQGIPTLIHEQNAFPGITNRVLAKWVKRIAITYRESAKYFPAAKTVLTGNPVRPEVALAKREEAIHKFGLDPSKKTVLVFGGSRGARSINKALVEARANLQSVNNLQIIHVSGKEDFSWVSGQKSMEEVKIGNVMIKPYLYNMPEALAAADLVICRAGATTLAEITVRGLPSILIPYPYATDNHQEYNARSLEKAQAALVVLDKDLNGQVITKSLLGLISDEDRLNQMSQESKKLGRLKAAKEIVDCLYSLLSR